MTVSRYKDKYFIKMSGRRENLINVLFHDFLTGIKHFLRTISKAHGNK
jgi:hypothetical protein